MAKCMLAIVVVLLATGCSGNDSGSPQAKRIPMKHELHGDVRVDNYYWLRERDNPEVIAYLEAENAYTEAMMEPMLGMQKLLYDEIRGRIKEDDSSPPYKRGEYYYYSRFVEGDEYPIYARKKGSLEADEEILLDVNELAGDAEFFALRSFKVSPDDKIAAYGIDTVGRRFFDLYFLDLESGELLPDHIPNTTSNFEWANDSQTILYGKQHPETLRAHRIYRHKLGDDSDTLVYEEQDETNSVYLSQSSSKRFIYLNSVHTLYTEVRYVPADSPQEAPKVFRARESNHEYFVVDGEDRFYVLSNDSASNFRLLQTPLDNTAKDAWTEVMAHRDDVLIERVDVFRDFVVAWLVENGLNQVEVIQRDSGETYRLDFGEEIYTAYSGDNHEFDSPWLRYVYESMTTPQTAYDFNMRTREHKLVKERAVLGGFDRNNYETERRFAPARDGTQIPVSIVYRKGLDMNGQNPLFQYGYGSYGLSIKPRFSASMLSLLDRGFVYAIAHIRGGAEMGREWYYDGRQLQKKNTFTDFIDVSKYLIAQGFTSPDHLYARGGSAGGLLMGAIANMAPDLYNGISTRVPFVDVVTTMLDAEIPLTSGEWDEWGDPAQKEFYDYIKSYSPYDNVQKMDYPHMLVTTALHDSQVQYWEPAKWVAKLREYKTDDNLLLLKTDMAAGHSGKSGRFQSIEDTALYYSFFLALEGIRE
jgi:oligopeptidase B